MRAHIGVPLILGCIAALTGCHGGNHAPKKAPKDHPPTGSQQPIAELPPDIQNIRNALSATGAADINGDGKPDLVETSDGTVTGTLDGARVTWSGGGSASTVTYFDAQSRPLYIRTTGDSHVDILYASDSYSLASSMTIDALPSQGTYRVTLQRKNGGASSIEATASELGWSTGSGLPKTPTVAGSCDDPKASAAVKEAFARALERARSCLGNFDPHMYLDLLIMLAKNNFVIECKPASKMNGDWAHAYPLGEPQTSCGDPATHSILPCRVIEVNENCFAGQCGDMASTMFHELLHFVYPFEPNDHDLGASGHSKDIMRDRVYGCEDLCYGALYWLPTPGDPGVISSGLDDCLACRASSDINYCAGYLCRTDHSKTPSYLATIPNDIHVLTPDQKRCTASCWGCNTMTGPGVFCIDASWKCFQCTEGGLNGGPTELVSKVAPGNTACIPCPDGLHEEGIEGEQCCVIHRNWTYHSLCNQPNCCEGDK